ncbi:low choriolytic enzyme-like [Antennarius striatus]|uniref:low choriolytic enzyme-like n=1 Tax=Antennarius striatus TaxID=241820 RepID=UPI0035AF1FC2
MYSWKNLRSCVRMGLTGHCAENSLPDISDIIAAANTNLSSSLVYDDIRIDGRRSADPCVTRGCQWPKSGDVVRVPFYISDEFNQRQRDVILSVMMFFKNNTCIRFEPWESEWSFLFFFSGTGCWSYLGNIGQPQPISLQKNGCIRNGTIQHEILHALGFHHEQNRSDRNKYVRILYRNILEGREINFQRVATNNLGTPYDYNSIMHYSKFAFSKNRRPTIRAKREPFVFGTATTMSVTDIKRVNRLYECCEKYQC